MQQRISRKQLRRRKRILQRFLRVGILCLMAISVLGIIIMSVEILNRLFDKKIQFAEAGFWQSYEQTEKEEIDEMIERLQEEGYPESLIELLGKHPEAKEFVMGYWKNKDKEVDIDLSHEVKAGEIPLFLQWDKRWGYQIYGDDFLAVTGCGPTCLSMVICGLGGETDWTPLAVAQMADREGYYVDGIGSSWDLMVSGAEQLGLVAYSVSYDESSILTELQNGNPIICVVGPGDFTTSGHFIVLAGVDEDGNIIVRDPNSKVNSETPWSLEEIMPQIQNLWTYSLAE